MNVRPSFLSDIRSVSLYVVINELSFVNCNITLYINKMHHRYGPGINEYGGLGIHERERGIRDSERGLRLGG
jgi:hypothetical protein